ncbi:hypothetical protein K432DRAFT_356302 [Lepidopterella palustris CBS 459.81]|uniref:Uncharacterized protein n=1 Tax=Lepidopterella palustris CBS 459.81 TaxID=1314670 RepID=A0A8E2E7A6_9PEZI|nr:hypothetical protein K432DRAFT_356302 [Lepidopterella palustris CBS 459.81]
MLTLPSTKRRRDEDELDSGDERYQKKSRSHSFQDLEQYAAEHALPLRPSSQTPPSHFFAYPSAMTPAHSDTSSNNSPAPLLDKADTSGPQLNDVDMDDDDLDIIRSQPPDSPFAPLMRPPKLNAQLFQEPTNAGGRIPTPIHGTFYPCLSSRSVNDISNMDLEDSPLQLLPVGISRKQPDRDRRMPSPISEDEADTPTTMAESRLSRLSVAGIEGMEMDEEAMQRSETVSSTTMKKKGRARSGAITDKRKFSMGYREDCDKCRARVPGHYSHFLPG